MKTVEFVERVSFDEVEDPVLFKTGPLTASITERHSVGYNGQHGAWR